ncbi:hypothetical protein MP631_00060 [Xanthomonas phaseoli pv. phaseoli]|nr:hypothetical protein MP631_00060 [Xanthomonas phaseoli pv. phaseoli]
MAVTAVCANAAIGATSMTSNKARESNFFMEYSWVESGIALIGEASNVSVERGKTRACAQLHERVIATLPGPLIGPLDA